ncbi:UPF0764 protein C16orf89 homolog [Watersipora subatra]|uniref:UPF0764 protein C16orf89 homolog n=1 Tax=Watersipora subatra TaxID=2589382 RepID=UPI00355C45D4
MVCLSQLLMMALLVSTAGTTFPSTGHIKHLLKSLEKVTEFYNAFVDQVNFDGLYGLRIVEGVLLHIKGSFLFELMDDSFKFKVDALLKNCQVPINKGIAVVNRDNPKQFQKLGVLLIRRYLMNYEPRNIKPELRWPFVLNIRDSFKVINERSSDECFGSLFASEESGSCEISKKCSKLVTTPNLRSYPLTHQILFSVEAAKTKKCSRSWSEMLGLRGYLSNTEFQRIWCTNSYYEMLSYVQTGRRQNGRRYHAVESHNLDLFFEILFVCPSIGFHEFLKEEYIAVITDAQDASGCFKLPNKTSSGRKLLEEKEMKDGCMFHLTAVGAGALAVYLHYTLVMLYTSERFHLDLINDNKHYLEAVELGRLELLPRKHTPSNNYIFYMILIAVNILFIFLIIKKGRGSSWRRFVKRLLAT